MVQDFDMEVIEILEQFVPIDTVRRGGDKVMVIVAVRLSRSSLQEPYCCELGFILPSTRFGS